MYHAPTPTATLLSSPHFLVGMLLLLLLLLLPTPAHLRLCRRLPTAVCHAGVLFWSRKEQVQCAVSTASVLAFAYLLVAVGLDYDWSAIVVRHGVPLLIMNYWLVMVTYLQHHESDTKVGPSVHGGQEGPWLGQNETRFGNSQRGGRNLWG